MGNRRTIEWRFNSEDSPYFSGEWNGRRWNGWLDGLYVTPEVRDRAAAWLEASGNDVDGTADDLRSIEPDDSGLANIGGWLTISAVDDRSVESVDLESEPCVDCGRPVFYDDTIEDYRHVDGGQGCFLIAAENR